MDEMVDARIRVVFGMIELYAFASCILLVFFHFGNGLQCYTCSYDEKGGTKDFPCVTEPWNFTDKPTRTCLSHINFCIIVRVDSKETGSVSSFLRKCEEKPLEDADIDSTTMVTHYRSCSTDLCNKGDGLNYIDEGYEGDSIAILVPDKSSSSRTNLNASYLFLVALALARSFLHE